MHDSSKPSLYEWVSRWFVILIILGTIAVEVAVPIVAWRWVQQPFPGLLLEQTLVVTGMGSTNWGEDVPHESSVRLIAVGDQPVASSRDVNQAMQALSPGQSVPLTFQPRSGADPFQAQTVVRKFSLGDWGTLFWLPYAVGLIYLAIGVWVFRHRGDRRSGQSFALFCTFVALATGTLFDLSTTHLFSRIWTAALPLAGASLLHLALVFPEENTVIRRQALLRFLPYLLATILVFFAEVRLYDPGDPWAYIAPWRWGYIGVGLAILAFVGLMLYARARTLSAIVRQQVRLILLGGLLAFAPIAIYMVLAGMAVSIPFQPALYLPPLVIFPVFIAFAILRYKLLGMDLLISRGLAYTILTASVAGAYFLTLTVLGQTLGIDLAHNNPVLLTVFVVILIFVLNPLREGTERLADQLLKRQRVDYRQALQAFSRELATTPLELSTLLQRLLDQITPISHSAPTLIFVYDPRLGRYTLRKASNYVEPDDQPITFSQDSEWTRWLSEQDQPAYLLDAEAGALFRELAGDEQAVIEKLGLSLFLPLRGQTNRNVSGDRLGGWVALGPRLSGEPYSPDDLSFLAALVDQAAIAIENAQLLGDLEQRVSQMDALRQISAAVDLRQDLKDLLDLIYVQTSQVLEIDNFYVALYDQDRREFRMACYVEEREHRAPPAPTWALGTGLTSQIVRQRRAIVTDDYLAECERRGVPPGGKPAKAWLGVPLTSNGRVLGVLNISTFQDGYRYTPEQVQLVTAIADQAAMAIDRMRLYQEMEFRAAELATLNEVSRTINSTLDLPSVLDLIMNKVVELLHVEAGSLLLLDPEAGDLVFHVVLGTSSSQDLVGRHHSAQKGIVGHVVQTGQALVVNDVQSDPRWNQEVDRDIQFITHGILCVPMSSRNQVIGVIEVINHRDGSPFLEEEASLLTSFAAQAAVAIENARLYTQTDQALAHRVEELSTMQRIDRELNAALDLDRIMDMTVEWALRGTGAPVGLIAMLDERRQGLLLLASRGYPPGYERYRTEPWPLDQGIVGRVIRTGEVVLVDDVTQDPDYHAAQPATRSQLSVPIRREEHVIGVVNIESPEAGAFNADDSAFVQRLADHAAIAIENARLYRESQRRAEDMALLYDISLTVSSHLALSQVLEAVYERIRDVWNPPVFFIALYNQEEDALDFPIYVDRNGRLEPFRQYLADKSGFSAWIVRHRQPILIRDWEKEVETSPVKGVPVGDLTRSWLGVPLLAGDQMVGVMSMQDYAPQAYNQEHQRFLSTIASEVAIAIENARLYQETQQRLKELSLLFDTSAALSTSLDVNLVLQTTTQRVTSALVADGCAISLWDREQDALVTLLDYSVEPDFWEPEKAGTLYPLNEYPASQQVLTDRRPRVVQASDAHADPAELKWMAEQQVTSLLMVPLVARDKAIGMLKLMQCHEQREFTPNETQLCQILANQAAAALENARLYEGVKDANEAKSEFIDFVAHELKQPMTAMQGYARMLTMGIGGQLTDMQQEFVRVINSNVDRMGKLVNDLLEISRLEAGRTKLRLAPVHMQEVVEETITNTRTEIDARQHTLTVELPDDLPPVLGDRERLVQILTNLVSNAYKYTPNGGSIEITVSQRNGVDLPSSCLVVSVRDNGIGMSPKELLNLEEKFFRADHDLVRAQPGTGLGVSITRSLVALHGGEFEVESEPGQGTTFCFTVPILMQANEE
jgi:GAF domain-containing protein